MDSWFDFGMIETPIRLVKVVPIFKPGTTSEPEHGPIALIGDSGMPVFRGKALHPYHVSYLNPTFGLPLGALLVGSEIDVIACAWTVSLNAEDRALLEGMRISPNFMPQPQPRKAK